MGQSMELRVHHESPTPIGSPKVGYAICSAEAGTVLSANNRYQNTRCSTALGTVGVVSCRLGMVPLMEGRYSFTLWFGNEAADTHMVRDALAFDVEAMDIWGNGIAPVRRASHLWWPTEFVTYRSYEDGA